MTPPLGIIAGGGDLPQRIIAQCQAENRAFFILAFAGQTSPELVQNHPHAWSRLGALGKNLALLKQHGVSEVVLAGHMRRPAFSELRPDLRAARVLARIGFKGLGDDALLRVILAELAAEGIAVIGAQEILHDLLAPSGVLGRFKPNAQALADIERGFGIVSALGSLDIGQACVVQQGLVLGVEAIEGTDALLDRVGSLARSGQGGVLVKCRKPGQEDRVDLPTIGLETVKRAVAAGLIGLAVESEGAIILDRDAVITMADHHDFFVIGLEKPGLDPEAAARKS